MAHAGPPGGHSRSSPPQGRLALLACAWAARGAARLRHTRPPVEARLRNQRVGRQDGPQARLKNLRPPYGPSGVHIYVFKMRSVSTGVKGD